LKSVASAILEKENSLEVVTREERLGWMVVWGLVALDVHTEFEVSRFSCFGDIKGVK